MNDDVGSCDMIIDYIDCYADNAGNCGGENGVIMPC